jgi:hypothetical protein
VVAAEDGGQYSFCLLPSAFIDKNTGNSGSDFDEMP